jgi:hypothetical protein
MGIFIGNPIDEVNSNHRSALLNYNIKIRTLQHSPSEIKKCILIIFYLSECCKYENRHVICDSINELKKQNGFPIISLLPENDYYLMEFLYKEVGVYPCTYFEMENVLRIENIFFKDLENFELEYERDMIYDPNWEKIYTDEFSDTFTKYIVCM